MKKEKEILKPRQIEERFSYLSGQRQTWENHWEELAQYILPNRDDFDKRSPGDKRNITLLDNSAMMSNELLAGALHGLLTSPNAQWFELTTGDAELDSLDGIRSWLQKVTTQMHNIINNSNFQTEVHQYYLDLTCFGTGGMSIEEDEDVVVRFASRHIKELFVAENNKGKIDEVYRKFDWNIRQLVAEFDEEVLKLSKTLMKAWEKKSDECYDIIHAVYPRDVSSKNPNDPRRYVSQYILCDVDGAVELKQAFFRELPFVIPRWTKASGEVYGRSPGMNALPDAKTLNKMTETVLTGAQKTVDPPLQLPDDGFIMPIKTRPGGLNFYRAGSADRITPVFADARIDFGFQAMNERRQRIREAFFVDQLQLNQGPQMTATEVNQRTEERMRLLGPILGRQHSEFLRPMIDRVFEIMARRNLIPPAPEALIQSKKNLDVTYSSMIAKAQRANDGVNIARTMQAVGPFASVDQSVLDNFDGDKAVREIAKIYGFPQAILRNQKDIEGIREARAQAQQAALQQQQETHTAETIGTAGPAVAQLEEASKQQQ
jgi:hypothetical protein